MAWQEDCATDNQGDKNEAELLERERFEDIWNGAPFSDIENILPNRDDFVLIYKFVTASCRAGCNTFSHKDMMQKLSKNPEGRNIGYIKLKIIIKVLQELNLMGIEETSEEVYRFTIKFSQKTNLEKSSLLKRLKNQQRRI